MTVTIDDPPCQSTEPGTGRPCMRPANHREHWHYWWRTNGLGKLEQSASWTDLAGDDPPPFQPDERLIGHMEQGQRWPGDEPTG